ncbi:methionine sulfoxide reductase [Candidatus Woesearchaeota archaeon]|nr:MAG: methionine sulfoxide reductase [Candidatus Woesearchaeota archaeon]
MKKILTMLFLIVFLLFIASCGENTMKNTKTNKTVPEGYKVATFAGGCFWCVESAFESLEGIEAISGYAGGKESNPTYKEVSSGITGHREAIQVYYDPTKYTYEMLLKTFWTQIDPTDDGGSFVDRGFQYTSAIFYHDEEQKKLAEESKKEIEKSGRFNKPIATKIIPFTTFYPAEEYHQDYHKKNSLRFKFYKAQSGRMDFIDGYWSDEYLMKKQLTDEQYKVAIEGGTEIAFNNTYWDEKREGIYVDVVTGEPLFSSIDKFDSGTGWPSFTKPIEKNNIIEKEDNLLTYARTEVRTNTTHLGHLFDDGPIDAGGMRYCINSASLRFIPKEEMDKLGYEAYLYLFNQS